MRSRFSVLVAAAAALWAVPQLAMAENVEEQLRQMNERMSQLENQLQATQDELEASQQQVTRQEEVMQKAGLDREAQSGLSGFYQQVQISGWIAGSWWWNFNNPRDATLSNQNFSQAEGTSINGGQGRFVAPFHPDHNSFSMDQLWFEIEKPVTEESRAGFRADLVWGKTASVLGDGWNRLGMGSSGQDDDCFDGDGDFDDFNCGGDSASDFYLYQAYIQYLTPFGPTVKAGKFETITGSEVAGTIYNYNISRGLLYTLLQPINHYGVMADGDMDGFVYALGVANTGFTPFGPRGTATDPDWNNAKSVLARVGYQGETFGGKVNVVWGPEGYGESSSEIGLVDVVLDWDPTESFSAWLNFDYAFTHNASGEAPDAWGLAGAGRYAFTDRFGLALRGEYLNLNNGYSSIGDSSFSSQNLWEFTLTGDYAITDNLILKAEARYDYVDCRDGGPGAGPCEVFVNKKNFDPTSGITNDSAFTKRSQWLGGLELSYRF